MESSRSSADVQATFCATLVDEFIREGLRFAFIAPGSRSTPMALAIAARTEITSRVLIDERSAAFAALGAGLVGPAPALVLCTSGTAATHFHGAVVEADLSEVPLLVVTADRPPELKDVGAPQTIDQTKLFGSSVRWFHDPGVPDAAAASSWRSLARRAMWSTGGVHAGPVHLNLPFREPLVGVPGELPEPSVALDVLSSTIGSRVDEESIATIAVAVQGRRGVIVVGRGCGSPENVSRLSMALGWPVFAEPRSGCVGLDSSVAHVDSVIRALDGDDTMRPDVVLRFGEPPASKVLAQWIGSSGAAQVHVGSGRRIIDPDHSVAVRVSGDVDHFASSLASAVSASRPVDQANPEHGWLVRWKKASEAARDAVDSALNHVVEATPVSTARAVAKSLSDGTNLVVSSSMPVRNLEWFGGSCDHVRVFSNRGANGIDGVVATAIGVATASGVATTVLIGDVALVHDLSSVASLSASECDVTLVVCDNDGGGIFEFLPQASSLDRPLFERLFGTPHGLDLVAVLGALGLPVDAARTTSEVSQSLNGRGPRAIVVRSDRDHEVAEHRELQRVVREALAGL